MASANLRHEQTVVAQLKVATPNASRESTHARPLSTALQDRIPERTSCAQGKRHLADNFGDEIRINIGTKQQLKRTNGGGGGPGLSTKFSSFFDLFRPFWIFFDLFGHSSPKLDYGSTILDHFRHSLDHFRPSPLAPKKRTHTEPSRHPPPVFLADKAYVGKKHLVVPRKTSKKHPLTEAEKTFERWHRLYRSRVEHAIGRLKRFKFMDDCVMHDKNIENAVKFVVWCEHKTLSREMGYFVPSGLRLLPTCDCCFTYAASDRLPRTAGARHEREEDE